jgi:hypothetical protein
MSSALVPHNGKLWVTVAIASVTAAALTYRVASLVKMRAEADKMRAEADPADRAYNALYDLWVEVGPSFMPWWQAQGMDTRTSVLRSARDAVRAELGKAAGSMDTLCPELRWGVYSLGGV